MQCAHTVDQLPTLIKPANINMCTSVNAKIINSILTIVVVDSIGCQTNCDGTESVHDMMI